MKGKSGTAKRHTDGRHGVIVCSECLEDKTKDEIQQVKDQSVRRYVCGDCLE